MRKLLVVVLMGLLLVVAFAVPALAQARDPFDPVITQSEATGSTGDGTGTVTETGGAPIVGGQTTVDGNGSDALAATGAETEPWLVAAFLLITIGAGAVLYPRLVRQTS